MIAPRATSESGAGGWAARHLAFDRRHRLDDSCLRDAARPTVHPLAAPAVARRGRHRDRRHPSAGL